MDHTVNEDEMIHLQALVDGCSPDAISVDDAPDGLPSAMTSSQRRRDVAHQGLTRREVLQLAAASGIGSFIGGGARAEAAALSAIGVQLYTVRDQVTKDAAATIKAVAEIGYGSRGPAGHAVHRRPLGEAERPDGRQHAPRRSRSLAGPKSIPSGNADLTATIGVREGRRHPVHRDALHHAQRPAERMPPGSPRSARRSTRPASRSRRPACSSAITTTRSSSRRWPMASARSTCCWPLPIPSC